jgi:hypothetical protein
VKRSRWCVMSYHDVGLMVSIMRAMLIDRATPYGMSAL